MEIIKSTVLDKIIAILFILLLPLIFLIIGVSIGINYIWITGIPFIIYGIIGLITKKVWLSTFRGPLPAKKNFWSGLESRKISIMYIILGLIISLVFYGIWIYLLMKMPETVNYL
jgi:hypothetical protein